MITYSLNNLSLYTSNHIVSEVKSKADILQRKKSVPSTKRFCETQTLFLHSQKN